jgi:hypothetical protein
VFHSLESNQSTPEHTIKSDIIEIMGNFEELDVNFENEKAKILQLERIKA